MIYVALAYSGNAGFDLIGTSSCEASAWDNVAEWCKVRIEGFPQDAQGWDEEAVKEWLSDNDAPEEVTVETIPDAMFLPGAAYVTVDEGVCGVTLWDDITDAHARKAQEVADPDLNPAAEHYIVPLTDGHAGQSED